MRSVIFFATFLVLINISSCNIKEQKRINSPQVTQIEDSIAKLIPGVRTIHTIQKDDLSKVMIIVGAPSFYDAVNDKKQQAAIRAGAMLMHVLGADNDISSATLVITRKDMDTNTNIPDDGIILDMKIDSLKKVMYPPK